MSGRNMPYLVSIGVIIVVFWLWSAWVYRHVYLKPMRRAIHETGRDLCIECGYDLAGLDAGIERCPECGGRREAKSADGPAEHVDA